jgi:Arc/MetJ-type ribon-helix-helix transcriptional regulator
MASATTKVIPVRVPLEMLEEMKAAAERALDNGTFEGEGTLSDWIRKALREVLDKRKRSNESYQRAKARRSNDEQARTELSRQA